MIQIAEMSDEQKVSMYSKLTKIQLIKMLIECNKIIANLTPTIKYPEKVKCDCPCHSHAGTMHFIPCCDNGWKYVMK